MRTTFLAALSLCALIFGASSLQAQVLDLTFTGTVTSIDNTSSASIGLSKGDTVSYVYRVDLGAQAEYVTTNSSGSSTTHTLLNRSYSNYNNYSNVSSDVDYDYFHTELISSAYLFNAPSVSMAGSTHTDSSYGYLRGVDYNNHNSTDYSQLSLLDQEYQNGSTENEYIRVYGSAPGSADYGFNDLLQLGSIFDGREFDRNAGSSHHYINSSLTLTAINSVGAPEAHEWALLLLAALGMVAFVRRQQQAQRLA
jgi:hypothetical protein